MAPDRNHIPRVQVVTGSNHQPGLRAKFHEALEPGRDHATRAVSVVFGIWPVFVIVALMIGLAWCFAMFQSP